MLSPFLEDREVIEPEGRDVEESPISPTFPIPPRGGRPRESWLGDEGEAAADDFAEALAAGDETEWAETVDESIELDSMDQGQWAEPSVAEPRTDNETAVAELEELSLADQVGADQFGGEPFDGEPIVRPMEERRRRRRTSRLKRRKDRSRASPTWSGEGWHPRPC